MASIVVIGAGVAGLTTALILARKGYKITVVAQHFPGDLSIDYTSPWAGANWLSTACSQEEQNYDRLTFEILWDLATHHPEAGIIKMSCIEYHDGSLNNTEVLQKDENIWFAKFVPDFRHLSQEELSDDVNSGFIFTSLTINPQIYLPYLQSQLLSLGTLFVRRHLFHIREAVTLTSPPPSAIVNATGILAYRLGGVEDKMVYPTRGQTILVRNECSKMYFRSLKPWNDEPTYVIPRPFGGGTILGGCFQHGNWSGEIDANLAHRIATKCVALAPELTGGKGLEALDVVRHNVGLRPSRRGGPRVEAEHMDDIGLVVHNYGASGAGYQSSWGMGMKATELLESALATVAVETRH